ncbi:alpha/beta fold hydrolase [Pseudofulvimonas gallinarii]|uniref:Alpha-beta hydrolase superfamily lysophospholipase n=1 Tax=Pseudofulvimonas gallinarii TaxID=634155 RepID=A0A4S3L0S9_9GAMM|nr:alpha/beta fold hydrolase [Pseudofulvimonas gallinarii]TCS99703.1 alpha-beta hydrolase superfamily lysophospholipase [Pseudofulvimonas gallinarii]THD15260.1 hypothetical protein B1808_00160 [Pseudofulvimonas gallinarii]
MTCILVHGAGGGGWQWTIWAGVLAAAGLTVLAPDLRPAASGLEATGWSDYLGQVRDWRRVSPPSAQVLVGASLGGLLSLASAAAEAPAALVLVNPVPPRGVQPWPALRSRPPRVAWSRLPFTATRAAMPDADLASARHAHARWRDESGRVLDAVAAGITVPVPACPVLVMASGHDADIPPATSRATACLLEADFVELGGCSHVGALLGQGAAAAATQALAWLRTRKCGGNSD